MAIPVILLYTLKAFLNERKLNIDYWSRLKLVESNILECSLEYTIRCYNYHDLKTIVLDSDVEFLKECPNLPFFTSTSDSVYTPIENCNLVNSKRHSVHC